MKKSGGIFDGPTALGTLGALPSCQADNSTLIRKVQKYLKEHGAPLLKIDGAWQGCTASAFRAIFGRPYVTVDDIKLMTGDTCSQDDASLGGILPSFTIQGVYVCTDGSDGASTTGGEGAVPAQQCASGQIWNDLLKMCVPNLLGGGGGTTTPTPQQKSCPAGQTWNEFFKVCMPDLFGGAGANTPGGTPTECAAGSFKTPWGCVGGGGVTQATECPSGQFKDPILGKCWPSLPGTGGGAQQTTPGSACPEGQLGVQPFCIGSATGGGGGAQQCPAGQMQLPLLGCVPNPFGGQTGQPGQPGGDIFAQIGSALQNLFAGLPGIPGVTPPAPPPGPSADESPFGSAAAIIAGLLGVGALAAGGIWLYKRSGSGGTTLSEAEIQAMVDADLGLLSGGSDPAMGDYSGMQDWEMGMYAPNRRRRGRRSRRRGRGRRR